MKAIDIALKDLLSSFRSAFAIIFMFVIPLLVTGMFYFMFGNMNSDQGYEVPVTQVIVANLDQGSADFQAASAEYSTLGQAITDTLKSPDLANLLQVSDAADAATARTAVDQGQAGVAVIIPADFTSQYMASDGQSTLEFYADPTLSLGPGIVRSVLDQVINAFSTTKISVLVAKQAAGGMDQALANQIVQGVLGSQTSGDQSANLLQVRAPEKQAQPENMLLSILGPIMGGMLIFYAFYTGTATAQTILREEEHRTLQRLFTTPTPQITILTGKFLSVFLTVLVQVCVLLLAAHLIFGIDWGALDHVALLALGTILAAATFGIFVNSLTKNTKQGGVIFGGVLTITGMTGMMQIFTQGSTGASAQWTKLISLLVPQGWAIQAMYQAMQAAPIAEILISFAVLLVWSAAFFGLGVWRFQKRYA